MVRNGVSVPVRWHVFVQVRPTARFDSSSTHGGGGGGLCDCGAGSPDKKRRAGGGFASPTKVNAAKSFTASSLIPSSMILRDILKLVQSIVVMEMNSCIIFTLIVYRIFKIF